MSKRSELIQQAQDLGEQLGEAVITENKTNAELAEIVTGLEERQRALPVPDSDSSSKPLASPIGAKREPRPPVDGAGPRLGGVPAPVVPDPPLLFEYQVAPGHALVCRRGVRDAGEEMRAEFVGGQKQLDLLVEKGHIIKGSKRRS